MWSVMLLLNPQTGFYCNPAQTSPSFGDSWGGELLFSASVTRKTSMSLIKIGASGIIDKFFNETVDHQSHFSNYRIYANLGKIEGKDKLYLKPFVSRTGIMIPGFIFINVSSFGASVVKKIYHGPEFFITYKRDLLSTDNLTFEQPVKNLSKNNIFLGFDSYRKSPFQIHFSGGWMFYDNATTSNNETRQDYFLKLRFTGLPAEWLSISAKGVYKHSNEPRYIKYTGSGYVDFSFDITDTLSLDASLNGYYTTYPNANTTEQGLSSSLELDYQISKPLSTGLLFNYTTQKSTQIDENWVSWFAGITFTYTFYKKWR